MPQTQENSLPHFRKIKCRFFGKSTCRLHIEMLVEICKQNTVFYEYTEARPTEENILDDMKATPPGIDMQDKYYFGFFDGRELVAIMDLIDGYPKAEIAYIGFFMMNPQYQGKQTGTAIIAEEIGRAHV